MNNDKGNKDKIDQKKLMVKYWLEKAESSLNSARREFEAGACDFSMNRIYYSAFYVQ